MKAKVISQSNRAEGEPPRSTKYALPIALTFGSALLTQCVEASIVNKNISYVAQDIRVFSNETSDLSAQDKALLQNYTTSASLLLNKLGEAGSLLFSPKDMSVYQYQGKNADGNTNNVEFAVNNISVNDQLSEQDTGKSIISFRNDNVAPTGEFDISTKSFLFDPQLPQTFIRTETTDHTVITVQGAELNKTITPFMIIVLDKLPADVDINKALQDPELAREVTIINPVTGESIIIPQDQDVIATEQANSSPSLINIIGKIIEPSGVVQAQGPQSEAPTFIPTEIPSTATALPPTETPVVKMELDKPMTTEFDQLNTEVMPSADAEMVRAGDLNEAVRQYWQETGLINPDGSINKPENVIPARPDDWQFRITPGNAGGDIFLGPFNNDKKPAADKAFQPTDLLFKVKNKAGEVTGILVTEALYYIDPSGKLAIEPVFFFVDISKTSNPFLVLIFGHEKATDGSDSICFPYVGLQDGEEGYQFFPRYFTDKKAYLSHPMQEEREAFARQVDATGNPQGMGNFWWAPVGIAGGHP